MTQCVRCAQASKQPIAECVHIEHAILMRAARGVNYESLFAQ